MQSRMAPHAGCPGASSAATCQGGASPAAWHCTAGVVAESGCRAGLHSKRSQKQVSWFHPYTPTCMEGGRDGHVQHSFWGGCFIVCSTVRWLCRGQAYPSVLPAHPMISGGATSLVQRHTPSTESSPGAVQGHIHPWLAVTCPKPIACTTRSLKAKAQSNQFPPNHVIPQGAANAGTAERAGHTAAQHAKARCMQAETGPHLEGRRLTHPLHHEARGFALRPSSPWPPGRVPRTRSPPGSAGRRSGKEQGATGKGITSRITGQVELGAARPRGSPLRGPQAWPHSRA